MYVQLGFNFYSKNRTTRKTDVLNSSNASIMVDDLIRIEATMCLAAIFTKVKEYVPCSFTTTLRGPHDANQLIKLLSPAAPSAYYFRLRRQQQTSKIFWTGRNDFCTIINFKVMKVYLD